MALPFDIFTERLRSATDLETQTDIANALGVHRSALTQAKRRDMVPEKWILSLSRSQGLSPDWLEFGTGPCRLPAPKALRPLSAQGTAGVNDSGRSEEADTAVRGYAGSVVHIPQVRARLCAGGGSFELEAVPVARHPLPLSWVSRMGRPDSMVFMDVMGDSMEPGIADGDMVLIDQSVDRPQSRSIMAVGFEDAIYIKRLEQTAGGMRLLSDNQAYAPIVIRGDEMDSFRVIGKIVWLCRDCR